MLEYQLSTSIIVTLGLKLEHEAFESDSLTNEWPDFLQMKLDNGFNSLHLELKL